MGDKDHREVVGSSIVLLQERFRQLQRLKEMRQERRLVSASYMPQPVANVYAEDAKSSTSFRDPLALGLNSITANGAMIRATQELPVSSSAMYTASSRGRARGFLDEHEFVDTSLRL